MSAVQPMREESPHVLVVDDEKVIREILSDFLTMEGHIVRTVENGAVALEELHLRPYDLVICDLKMPKMGGMELLDKISDEKLDVLPIIMTGFGTVETAIEAMKKGAYDYILKPFKVEEVIHVVERGLDRRRLHSENIKLREAISLYRISEAIATSLDLDYVLNVILDAVVHEVEADVVTLQLMDPRTGRWEERVKRVNDQQDVNGTVNSIDIQELLRHFEQDSPLVAHGIKASRFFVNQSSEQKLVSFAAVPMKFRDKVLGTMNAFSFTRGKKFSEGQRKMMVILGSRAAVSIENARLYEDLVGKNLDLKNANLSLEQNFQQTIVGFAHALEESDRYTRGHSERVAIYSRLIAQGMQLPNPEVETVFQAGLMHDIGKIGIRNDKLNKPGKLSPEEVGMFRTHPAKGKRILEPIPFMRNLIPGCWCHHECFDGSGYPQAVAREDIPLLGRIVAVADAYDAMTSDRAYRRALPHDIAMAELERCSGAQFDPAVVDVFSGVIEAFRREQDRLGNLVPR